MKWGSFHWFQKAMGEDLGDILKQQNFTYSSFWKKKKIINRTKFQKVYHNRGLQQTSGHDMHLTHAASKDTEIHCLQPHLTFFLLSTGYKPTNMHFKHTFSHTGTF